MKKNSRRRAATLIEVTFVALFASLIITGSMMMTVQVGKSFNRTTTQHDVDQSASRGIQRITRDLQEARQFTIVSSSRLRIIFPVSSGDSYNRKIADTANPVEYYRGNEDGTVNPSGTFLVRLAGGVARPVAENLNLLSFSSDSPSSVIVDTQFRRTVDQKTFTATMTHRAILMRNYSQ